MPFWNAAMARSGRLFAGQVQVPGGASDTIQRGVRWVPGAAPVEVFEADTLGFTSHAEGDTALFVMDRSIVYSPAAGERVDIEPPADAPPDASFARVVLAANGTHFVAVLVSASGARLYRWADSSFERIELPEGDWWIDPLLVSDDGQVVVAGLEGALSQRHVRWSADTGTQVLSDDPTYLVEFMSSAGDIVLGNRQTDHGYRQSTVWRSDDMGLEEIPSGGIAGRVAFDGNVLLEQDDDGILARKYGPALDVALPVDHLQGRLPFERPLWLSLGLVSADARVLGGSATDDPGNEWLWLARLQTICPGAP